MDRCRVALLAVSLASLGARDASGLTCALPGLHVWPPSGTVPLNVTWVLDGAERSVAERLKLVGAGETIGFSVSIGSQSPSVQQFMLRASAPLRPGEEYQIPWPFPVQGSRTPPPLGTWRVLGGEDHEPPAFLRPTTVEFRFSGDGPGAVSRAARFDIGVSEPALSFVTIEGEGRRAIHEQFLMPPRVSLGSGPCGGNFTFDPRVDRYTGTVRLMDAAGNWSEGPGEPINIDTSAELAPQQRYLGQPENTLLPTPREAGDVFSEEQWQAADRFVAEHPSSAAPGGAFVPYDAGLFARLSFLGMREEVVRGLLRRGGSPRVRSPVGAVYVYAMVPPPAGYSAVELRLGIDYDDELALVVRSESFLPNL